MNTITEPPKSLDARVAVFLPSLSGGGAERVLVSLSNAFVERGYSVDLVLAKAQGPYLMNVSPKVRIVDLKAGRVIKALFPLALYLRRERPTSLLSAMTHANVISIMARLIAGVSTRLIVSERSTISIEKNQARGLAARIMYKLVPRLYRFVDGIIAVSEESAVDLAHFSKLDPSLIKVIYNPFDIKKIKNLALENINHAWFDIEQPPVVLGIGRLTEQKNFPNLIHAVARLRNEGCMLRLLILGEGELRSQLEKMVADYGLTTDEVQLPGFTSNPFPYLARCDVFVLSSNWEGLPGTLIEAMACGAPVISTDCPSGPREILQDERWGTLVPVDDVDALVKAIQYVLETSRAKLPDVQSRAEYFDHRKAVDAYLNALGLNATELSLQGSGV